MTDDKIRPNQYIIKTEKLCFHCKTVKPASEYHKGDPKKGGLAVYCKQCTKIRKQFPYNKIRRALYMSQDRCKRNYAHKGIECHLTIDDVKLLWNRDNCQFIEHSLNAAKDRRRPVLQYDLNGNFLMEFPSITHAAAFVGSSTVSIWRAVKGDRRFSYGYMWRYKTSKGIPKIIDIHSKYKGKTIIQMDLNGVFIREYDSVAQAAKEMGCTSSAITYALKGIGRTAMGFLWKYKE